MKKYVINFTSMCLVYSLALLVGCGGSNNFRDPDSNNNEASQIIADVIAAQGGVFSSPDGNVTIEIPANALSQDTTLEVTLVGDPEAGLGNLVSAGQAYNIDIGEASLSQNMNVEISLDSTPTHPELAEIAIVNDGNLESLSANFHRKSNNTVVAITQQNGLFMPVLRTLQSETSDGVDRGREIFLNETFGNEDFFGGVVGLHTLLNETTPMQAVQLGVQVDLTRVPQNIIDVLQGDNFEAKQAALNNPATTRSLLIAGAVLGVKAIPNETGDALVSAGLSCAICHGVVETNDFEIAGSGEFTTLPIGLTRLNGTPNTQIDIGGILALTPFAVNAGQETIDFLNGFGLGGFDPRALPDNPLEDGVLNPTSIPALWNFVDLDEQGYSYNWDGVFSGENAIASRDEAIYDLALHVNGAFGTANGSLPPALLATPSQEFIDLLVAAEDNAPGNNVIAQDLLDLQSWERSLTSPAPGDYDEVLAEEGFKLFYGDAQCSSCHSSPEFTGPVFSSDIVLVAPQGGLAGGIKTPGLRGIALTAPYFHDNSAATLLEVMEVYSGRIVRELSDTQMMALAEYMKSL